MLKLVALYVLIGINFDTFVLIIENLKTPISHVSTMAQYIKRIFFGALKSHDYHVLM
jgi:dihydroorotase